MDKAGEPTAFETAAVAVESPTEVRTRLHFSNLDAIRTIAFVMVFVSHCINKLSYDFNGYRQLLTKLFQNGDLGVKLFFVLSGFLITFLILEERNRTGSFSLRYFYFRRILRIWPVYCLVVLVGFIVVPGVMQTFGETNWPFKAFNQSVDMIWPFLLFLANFIYELGINLKNDIVNVLWSISIEEQFYFFWPLLLLLVSFRKAPTFALLILLMAGSVLAKVLFFDSIESSFLKFNTLSLAFDLSFGCLCAFVSFYFKSYVVRFLNKIPLFIVGTAYFCIVLLILTRNIVFRSIEDLIIESVIFPIIFGLVVLDQCFRSSEFLKLGQIRVLDKWGKYTYGLYCYHFIALFCVGFLSNVLFGPDISNVVSYIITVSLSLGLTMWFAYISYNFFEVKFLRLKEFYAR